MNIYSGGKLLNTMEYYEKNVKYRPLQDTEIKALFEKIKLNTDFSFPDRMIQDFVNDGSINPTFKKCGHFNKEDFNQLVIHLKKRKNIKMKPSKPKSKKMKTIDDFKPIKNIKIKTRKNKRNNK
jgi:hypothetical protein